MSNFNLNWDNEKVERATDGVMQVAVEKGANLVLKDAKVFCPVKTGKLRNTGRVKSFKKKGVIGTYVKFGNKKTYYAPFVELGTPGRDIDGSGFLRKALKKNKHKIRLEFRNKLK